MSLLVALAACAPISEIKGLRSLRRDTYQGVKPEDVSYSSDIRGLVWKPHSTKSGRRPSAPPPLFDENGQKMRSIRQLQDRVSLTSKETWTFGDRALFWSTMVYVIPIGVVTSVLDTVMGAPAAPFVFHTYHKIQKDTFEQYKEGDAALRRGEAKAANAAFMQAQKTGLSMAQDSDLYFKIAKTYQAEGDEAQRRVYLRRFLDYSVLQYPDYFSKYDPAYSNDSKKLAEEFQEAETAIGETENHEAAPAASK